MDDVGDGSPLADVGTLERNKFGCLVEHLTLANDKLMQRVDVHQLVVRSGCFYLGLLFIRKSQLGILRKARFI